MKIIELFAGIGGFRIGFESANKNLNSDYFKVVWSNQWEPNERAQYASQVYVNKWGEKNHSNEDIETICEREMSSGSGEKILPKYDLLVGGFPCQDYSVAKTLRSAEGIHGKKGVLWWSIYKIISITAPKYVLLENVDRLISSPAKQRGRDFAIMLSCLNDLGYVVEWRIINAAEYGFAQRRKRIFIFASKETTKYAKKIIKSPFTSIYKNGIFPQAFPVIGKEKNLEENLLPNFSISDLDLDVITTNFNKGGKKTPFLNSGISFKRNIWTERVIPNYSGKFDCIKNHLVKDSDVPAEYYISKKEYEEKWFPLKDAKKIERISKSGIPYLYSEGRIACPDELNKPARTIITSEGGKTPSRFKHIIFKDGKYRRLTPVELEGLSGFPKNHTRLDIIPDKKRAFFIGNALVTGVVDRLGISIYKLIG